MKKRIAGLLLGILMILSSAVPALASEEPMQVYSDSSYNNVIGGVSFIEYAVGMEELREMFSAESFPSGVYFNVDSELNVTDENGGGLGYTLREACVIINGFARPVVRVNDEYTARAVCTFFKYSGVKDFFVVSDSTDILRICRKEHSLAVLALDLTDKYDTVPTLEELRGIYADAARAGAGVVIFSPEAISRESVRYLYIRTLSIWCMTEEELDTFKAAEIILSGVYAVVSRDFDVLYETSTEVLPEGTITRLPINVGHRGHAAKAPHNSIEGFLFAQEDGADAVEMDVWLTKDKKVVLDHDGEFPDGTRITEYTYDELKEKGYNFPLLSEVYDAIDRELVIYLEIKDSNREIIEKINEITTEYDCFDRIVVICFWLDVLQDFRKEIPQVACSWLTAWLDCGLEGSIEMLRPLDISISPAWSTGDYGEEIAVDMVARAFPMLLWTFGSVPPIDEFVMDGYLSITNDIPDRFTDHALCLDVTLPEQIVPGEEYKLTSTLLSYVGEPVKAKKITYTAFDESVTVSKNSVTFEKAGSFYILVSAEYLASKGSLIFNKLLRVDVPTYTQTYGDTPLLSACSPADANGDGTVDVTDISAILKNVADCQSSVNADVNGDGKTNVKDAALIIRALAAEQ